MTPYLFQKQRNHENVHILRAIMGSVKGNVKIAEEVDYANIVDKDVYAKTAEEVDSMRTW